MRSHAEADIVTEPAMAFVDLLNRSAVDDSTNLQIRDGTGENDPKLTLICSIHYDRLVRKQPRSRRRTAALGAQAPLKIELHHWGHTRPCRFSLCLEGGSVYADFDVDEHQRAYLVRISFDGYGCCECASRVDRMSVNDSTAFIDMVERRALADPLALLLRTYLEANKGVLWEDALRDHDLIG